MGSTGFPARVDRLESLSHPIRFSYFMAWDEFLGVPLIYPKLALKRGLTLILIVPANCNKIALSFDL